jgi:uncharacterized iron-regulated membrane protein
MLRLVLLIHRYLAVAVGLVMAMWCLSGFVMMYQPFPSFTAAERLAGLAPLRLEKCCQTAFLPEDTAPMQDFRIEMLNGQPVLRQAGTLPFELDSGAPLHGLPRAELLQIAADHAAHRGIAAVPAWVEEVGIDQWSIQGANRNRPVQRIALRDAAATELYINGATGEIFQDTSRRERILSWFGAVPHWLYPTVLRRNGPVWAQVVIWTSLIGTFLAVTGLYVGISRLQRRAASFSPFRGWWYWHHLAGLVFGVLVLSWVFSGLMTMNPWGLLIGSDGRTRVSAQLAGTPPVGELRQFLQAVPTRLADGEFVQLESQPLGGRLFVLARRADGSTLRLDAAARPAPLATAELEQVLKGLDTGVQSLALLSREDAYYYGHKRHSELPVWRAILDDAEHTRLYLLPATGEFQVVDHDGRWARWLYVGPHSLDFAGLRRRPLWDVVTLLLLAGATAVCVTGSWMAIQRVRKDLSRS